MPITLQESLRGLLYAPYYAALALGAFRCFNAASPPLRRCGKVFLVVALVGHRPINRINGSEHWRGLGAQIF